MKKIMQISTKKITTLYLISIVIVFIISGCGAHRRVHNTFSDVPYQEKRYSCNRLASKGFSNKGDIFLALSFSGGGTRAAAFSYGALSELRDTQVKNNKGTMRLLDEVDYISSVSGGSFTAAYYGLFGDRIFDDFETVFLRRNIQKTLISSILNPINWFRFLSSGFDRGTIAVDYFDSQIFEGKTFGDIADRDGPFIQINATDLATGQSFAFTHETFSLLCSDLYDFKVARAVAASSAVPVAFPPVTLKNYPGCENDELNFISSISEDTFEDIRMQALAKDLSTLTDKNERKYIHLVDGGIADNLGVRAMLYRMLLNNKKRKRTNSPSATLPRDLVIIIVNAQTSKRLPMNQSPKSPSSLEVMGAVSAAQISRYNMETIIQTKQLFKLVAEKLSSEGQEVNTYFIELKFEDIPDSNARHIFNNMATSFSLPDDKVDLLYKAGRELLKDSKEFQRLLQNLNLYRQ